MRVSDLRQKTVAATIALLLNGCEVAATIARPSGGVQIPPAGVMQSVTSLGSKANAGNVIPMSLAGESFNATKVIVTCNQGEGSFHALGKAAGPYPGAVETHGSWRYIVRTVRLLTQHFTIISGTLKITGLIDGDGKNGPCERFGPSKSTYISGYGYGTAEVTVIKNGDLVESFLSSG